MKKIKKLLLLFGVGLILTAPVFGLFPYTSKPALAAEAKTGTWWSTATSEERVNMYILIMAVSECASDTRDQSVTVNDLDSYKFFPDERGFNENTPFGHSLAASIPVTSGDKENGGDGKVACNEEEGQAWVETLVNLLGDSGVVGKAGGSTEYDGSAVATACFLGWDREEGNSSDDIKTCVEDSGKFKIPEDEKGVRTRTVEALTGVSGNDAPFSFLSAADKYYLYMSTFMAGCMTTKGEVLGEYATADTDTKAKYDSATLEDKYFKVPFISSDGKQVDYIVRGERKREDYVVMAAKTSGDAFDSRCFFLVESNKNTKETGYILALIDDAIAEYKANPERVGGIVNGGEGIEGSVDDLVDVPGTGAIDTTCGDDGWWDGGLSLSNINPLDWLSCSLLAGFQTAAEKLEDSIVSMLCINESEVWEGVKATCSDGAGSDASREGFYSAWNAFRILALGLLAVAGLVMILSQALGFELFDAYTIKKTLPRILIAAVGISLSWQLLQFLITFSNALGVGIRGLIYWPFLNAGIDDVVLGGGAQALTGIFAVGSFIALGALGMLSFVGTALLAILVAFFVLIIRNILVLLLIIIAPIAIAAYVLPNTEKYYKTWWEWLFKALLMFPMITAFIALGHVFAAITSQRSGGILNDFVAFAAYFAPYFLIPLTFRFAGGALSTLGGFVNDRGRGSFDRLKKFRQGQTAHNMEAIRAGKRWQGNRVGERLSRTLQTGSIAASGGAGFNPMRFQSRTQATRSSLESSHIADADKMAEVRAIAGNDDLLAAGLAGRGNDGATRTYLEGLGQSGRTLEQNVASVRAARRALGRDAFEEYAAVSLAGTGTGYAGGPSEMLDEINAVAGSDRAKAGRMLAAARGQAERAKRVDLYGAGMASSADQMEQLYRGQTTAAAVDEILTDEGLNAKGASEIGLARNNAVGNMQGAIARRIARAQTAVNAARATGNQAAIDDASHEYKRVLAHTASLLDSAGSSSPENAQIVGAMLGQNVALAGVTINDGTVNPTGRSQADTLGRQIEQFRGDIEFQQYRREYGSGQQAAAAGAVGPGGPAGPPPPPPPAGP